MPLGLQSLPAIAICSAMAIATVTGKNDSVAGPGREQECRSNSSEITLPVISGPGKSDRDIHYLHNIPD
jgi:hypothetical protein